MSEDLNDSVLTEAEDTTLAPQEAELDAQNEQPGDDPAANAEEAPKPKKSAQQRIDELTWKSRENERQAEYWRNQAELLARQRQTEPAIEPQPVQSAGQPDPNAYEYGVTDERYIDDLTAWRARATVLEVLAEHEAKAKQRAAQEGFMSRVSSQFPNGEPVGLKVLMGLPELSQVIADVILTTENGPKLADHLGTNLREFQRISAMPPHLQAFELAKIEQRLTAPVAIKPNTVTNAPTPAPQVRGSGGRFTVAPDTNDFAAFEKQYGG